MSTHQQRPHFSQRGDITVYMALTMIAVIGSAILLLSGILLGQLKTTQDVVESERAFYAANSGLERGLYELSLFATPAPLAVDDVLDYAESDTRAVYRGTAAYAADGLTPCVRMIGAYPVRDNQTYPDSAPQAQERRLNLGPADCLE